MKLKLNEAGLAIVQDGKPVYVHDDGKEIPFDAAETVATIRRLNGEAKGHRERAEEAERKLKAFDGIADPAQALKALNTVKNLDDKKLVDAGEVEKVKQEAIKALEEKYGPVVAERDKLMSDLYAEKIGGSFARSKFIQEKVAIPPDLVQAAFGKHFEIKDGKIFAKDQHGNQIFSRQNPGSPADFEEALETLISAYPQRDSILKSTGSQGSGKQPNGQPTGPKQLSRSEFDKLDPVSKASKMKEGFALVD